MLSVVLPAGHCTHGALLDAREKVPRGHGTHALVSAESWKPRPQAQSLTEVAPALAIELGGQSTHAPEEGSRNCRTLQPMQVPPTSPVLPMPSGHEQLAMWVAPAAAVDCCAGHAMQQCLPIATLDPL